MCLFGTPKAPTVSTEMPVRKDVIDKTDTSLAVLEAQKKKQGYASTMASNQSLLAPATIGKVTLGS